MVTDWKFIGKINNSIVIRVTAKGDGLALTIPKEICETYNIISGDTIKIVIQDHFRKEIAE